MHQLIDGPVGAAEGDELPGGQVRFRILGPVEVWHGEQRLGVGGPQQRMLLAVLLVNANQVVPADRLIAHLWGERPAPSGRDLLQTCVARLRRALRAGGADAHWLLTRPPGYTLRVEPGELDADRFEELTGAATRLAGDGSPPALDRAGTLLREALALWRGPALADIAVDVCRMEAARLDERRLAVLEERVDVDLRLGRHGALIGELQSHVAAHPLRERAWAQLMLTLHAAGRQAEALAAYRRLRDTLVEQLGVEPNDTVQRIHHAILSGADPVEPYRRAMGRSPAVAAPGPSASPPATVAHPVPRELPPDVYGFTGRSDELARLDKLLEESTQGQAVVISAVSGTAGVGKTTLAVHWAHQVADRFPDGQLYVDLRGYDPDQPMDAADALAGFLRALGVAGQDVPYALAERAARYRSLLAGRRVLVVLDNAGRVEQVRPLLPGSRSCFTVVTSRDGLAGLVARDGARRVELDLLSPTESLDLLRALIGDRVDADPEAASALARRCAHLPLALRVAAQIVAVRPARRLADLVGEHHALDVLRAGDDDRSAVRSVFGWSYRRLPAATARMFRLLGLHPGADLDAYAAAALAGADPARARRLLDDLTDAHLVQENAAGRYHMHDLLRAYAAEHGRDNDDGERRAALSRLIGYYLTTAAAAMDLLYPGERHLRPRVPAVAEPAPGMQHAEHARTWLDAERANLAATVGYAVEHGWPTEAADLAATVARYLAMGAHFDEALVVHGHALRAAIGLGDGHRQAAALTNLGGIHYDLGRYDEAVEHYRRARPRFRGAGDRIGEARVLSNIGIMHAMRGRYSAALHHYRQALDIYRETGNEHGYALTLGWVGLELGRRGDHAEALDHLTHALAAFRRIGPRYREFEVLIDLGRVHHWAGHHDEALAFAQQVIALKDDVVDRFYEVHALNLLAEIHRATGRAQEALACYRSALALAPDIGHPEAHARALAGIADLEHAAGRPDAARRHWQEALALYADLQMPEADEIRARLDAG